MVRALRALALPVAAPAPAAALHRRRQQVVVRAPGSSRGPADAQVGISLDERRLHSPTLAGLGFRDEADTLPVINAATAADETTPISCVRTKVSALASAIESSAPTRRARPVTLLDDVHDGLSRDYLAEAARLVASGIWK